jgi:hypothetical protein
MRNITLKSTVYLIVGLSSLIWFGLAWIKGLNLSNIKDFFGLLPTVITYDLIIMSIFVKWGWKFPIFRPWLVPFPNLKGTWIGKIYSEWVNPNTGDNIAPIPVMIVINQSFFHISCVMHTEEMISHSYSEGLSIDIDKQIKQFSYSYTCKPRISLTERSMPHDGTTIFQIVEQPDRKLKGRYWTERKVSGEIIVSFHSKDMLEELPDNLGDHPVTEERHKLK